MNSHQQDPQDVPDPLPPAGPPVAISDDYEAFGLWMNVQLSQLVARWKHLAAPRASRNSEFGAGEFIASKRFSKPRKAK